jgi:hypothetical protein
MTNPLHVSAFFTLKPCCIVLECWRGDLKARPRNTQDAKIEDELAETIEQEEWTFGDECR